MDKSKKQELTGVRKDRRRGRPTGKNRVPLSLEERRARNALYERERRDEASQAFRELAEAIACDSNISNAELLATALCFIRQRRVESAAVTIADLERQNERLQFQITKLSEDLAVKGQTVEEEEEVQFVEEEATVSSIELSLEALTEEQRNLVYRAMDSEMREAGK